MDVLNLLAIYVATGVTWIWRICGFIALGLGAWAVVDTLMRPAQYFPAAGKRSKGFWIGINAAGLAAVLMMGFSSMFGLIAVTANAVYLTDVRPALQLLAPVNVRSRTRVVRNNNNPDDSFGWRR